MDDLVMVRKLNVVALDEIEVINSEALEAVLYTPFRALAGVVIIATGLAIAANFSSQIITVTGNPLERPAQIELSESPPVGGRDIDQVNAAVDGRMDRFDAIVESDIVENGSQGRRTEAKAGDFQAGLAEEIVFHVYSGLAGSGNLVVSGGTQVAFGISYITQ